MRDVCEALMCGAASSGGNMDGISACGAVAGAGGGSSTGEVRRLNVVYFLSRDGRIEHPHLIRVHHFYRNGVHLQDVKRWLGELRGKDMPNSYSWSYKRRYKSGYVWQDLMDDDLITPISDNEYVLKGSFMSTCSTPCFPRNQASSLGEEKTKEAEEEEKEATTVVKTLPALRPETLQIETDDMVSPKPPPQLDQDSPGRASTPPSEETTATRGLFEVDVHEESSRKEKQEPFLKKSSSGKRILRSLLACRAVETIESAQKPVHRRDSASERWDHLHTAHNPHHARKSWSVYGGKGSRKEEEKVVPTIHKPIAEPNCSQCGKAFKPEKLHSHMKSCKALKGHRRSSSNIEKLPLRVESYGSEEFSREAVASFFLAH